MDVLLVTSRYPWPSTRGNQVRTVEWLRALDGHRVRLVSPRSEEGDEVGEPPVPNCVDELVTYQRALPRTPWSAICSWLEGQPAQEALFATKSAMDAVAAAVRRRAPDVVIVQMVRTAWVQDVLGSRRIPIPTVFDAIDSMGLHFGRMATTCSGPLRLAAALEAKRCRLRETLCSERAAVTLAVSPRDLEAVRPPGGRGRVVPVSAAVLRQRPTGTDGPVIVLSGNLGYRPTRDGAVWFSRAVWPRLRQSVSGVRWVLAGARPPRAVRRLARLEGVEVVADPPDLDAFLARSTVAIAPMRSGSGVPMKVLEAWGHGLPVVAHPWPASGLIAEGGRDLLIAETAEEWIGALVRIFTDGELATGLGSRGRECLVRGYSPEGVSRALSRALEEACSFRSPTSSASRTAR